MINILLIALMIYFSFAILEKNILTKEHKNLISYTFTLIEILIMNIIVYIIYSGIWSLFNVKIR